VSAESFKSLLHVRCVSAPGRRPLQGTVVRRDYGLGTGWQGSKKATVEGSLVLTAST